MSAAKTQNQTPKTGNGADAIVTIAFAAPQKMIEANMQASLEIMDFMYRRMKARADFFDALSHCRDAGQIIEAQQKFWDRASKEYSEEMGVLTQTAGRTFAAMTDQATRH